MVQTNNQRNKVMAASEAASTPAMSTIKSEISTTMANGSFSHYKTNN